MFTVFCRRLSVSLWRCSSVPFRLISRCLSCSAYPASSGFLVALCSGQEALRKDVLQYCSFVFLALRQDILQYCSFVFLVAFLALSQDILQYCSFVFLFVFLTLPQDVFSSVPSSFSLSFPLCLTLFLAFLLLSRCRSLPLSLFLRLYSSFIFFSVFRLN